MAAELVVSTSLVLLVLLVAVQAGLWWHAVHIADAVAAHALAGARVQTGTALTGQESGQRAAAQLAGSVLLDITIDVDRGTDLARADISGTAVAVIPGLHLPVRATASGPVEPAP